MEVIGDNKYKSGRKKKKKEGEKLHRNKLLTEQPWKKCMNF